MIYDKTDCTPLHNYKFSVEIYFSTKLSVELDGVQLR